MFSLSQTFEDTTYFADPTNSSGWLSAWITTAPGSQRDAGSYNASYADSRVAVEFNLPRGNTYLVITKAYSQSLAVLVGAVLGYLSSNIALFAVAMRVLEAADTKCWRKRQPSTVTNTISSRSEALRVAEEAADFAKNEPQLKAAATTTTGEIEMD